MHVQRQRVDAALADLARVKQWVAAGVPDSVARDVAAAEALFGALDIAEIVEATRQPLAEVAELHDALARHLGLQRLQQQIDALPAGSYWENLAKIALGDDLSALLRLVVLEVLGRSEADIAQMQQAWLAENRDELEGAGRLVAELAEAKTPDLAMLQVAMRKLRNLA